MIIIKELLYIYSHRIETYYLHSKRKEYIYITFIHNTLLHMQVDTIGIDFVYFIK